MTAGSATPHPAPIATCVLTYRGRHCLEPERRIECEVYQLPTGIAVHTLCPRCLSAQWIDSERKGIRFEAESGALWVEAFECTWELQNERRQFGFGLCRCRVEYAGHEIRDA